jgi:hypothetical protein
MDARNNLANQEVFRMARVADPAGIRTVGIITKCDAVQTGDEQNVRPLSLLHRSTLTSTGHTNCSESSGMLATWLVRRAKPIDEGGI